MSATGDGSAFRRAAGSIECLGCADAFDARRSGGAGEANSKLVPRASSAKLKETHMSTPPTLPDPPHPAASIWDTTCSSGKSCASSPSARLATIRVWV